MRVGVQIPPVLGDTREERIQDWNLHSSMPPISPKPPGRPAWVGAVQMKLHRVPLAL